jgi:hypothetical protein
MRRVHLAGIIKFVGKLFETTRAVRYWVSEEMNNVLGIRCIIGDETAERAVLYYPEEKRTNASRRAGSR